MSEFLKFAYEIISQIVYYIARLAGAAVKLFITGWVDYILIFKTYFFTLNIVGKILSILLMIVLLAIPVLIVYLIVQKRRLKHRLKTDKTDNAELYKEIGRLNKQVLQLVDEKNSILALKVNTMGGTEHIPYMGASALTDDVLPSVGNVTTSAALAAAKAKAGAEPLAVRFPKLALVDQKYRNMPAEVFDNRITLEEFAEGYRLFAASAMNLYYSPEIVRRFIAGMSASKLLILEGISGTGKTSLPYSFSRYLNNPATIISVQPSYRDRTELLGYFNEFSKKFNETEFLRALYEASYRQDPSFIVLDEMNLARIEYYFAEILSVLEMPSKDEWVLDLVPTAWANDPAKMHDGKITVQDNTWFVGTRNNDDSTFTITDKVYDRAIPIEINERADSFECEPHGPCNVSSEHLQNLFEKARIDHPISQKTLDGMDKLNDYLMTRFKLSFGNRIIKQIKDFVPAFMACGGTELEAVDFMVAKKVLRKFESLSLSFMKDELTRFSGYLDKVFGRNQMKICKDYIDYLKKNN